MERTEKEIRELLNVLIKHYTSLEEIMSNTKDYSAASEYKHSRKAVEDILYCLDNEKLFNFYMEHLGGEK